MKVASVVLPPLGRKVFWLFDHRCSTRFELVLTAPQAIVLTANTNYTVTPLGLEPRTLALKVRCSNPLSYEVVEKNGVEPLCSDFQSDALTNSATFPKNSTKNKTPDWHRLVGGFERFACIILRIQPPDLMKIDLSKHRTIAPKIGA